MDAAGGKTDGQSHGNGKPRKCKSDSSRRTTGASDETRYCRIVPGSRCIKKLTSATASQSILLPDCRQLARNLFKDARTVCVTWPLDPESVTKRNHDQ